MSLPGTIGRYRIRRRLGAGAFATVHAAVDEVLDTQVAVKVLDREWSADPEVRERFVQEARLLRRVEHPSFVRVFDVGQSPDGQGWFAMTLAARGTLADRLDARGGSGAWTGADLRLVIDTLASGLTALERVNVVHRDITPRNMLIDGGDDRADGRRLFDDDDRLLIADLGLAKDLSIGADTLTMLGGTPRFQAPEQSTPMAKIDHRADIFAATAVVWHVVTGSPPPTPGELRARLTELTAPWHRAMAKGMAVSPDDRFSSITEWAESFGVLLEQREPVLAPAVGGDEINPYPGLRAFDDRRAAFYSGREALVDEVLNRLRKQRALIIGGPSGAGKSSLLRAGLMSRLGTSGLDARPRWSVALVTPGADPLRRLAEAIAITMTEDGTVDSEPPDPTVVLIDQFEEVITRCGDSEQRTRFVAAIRDLAEIGTTTRVVMAIRSDFYGILGSDPWLAGMMANHVFVGPMSRADLRRAVERPALRAGVSIEAALVEQVIEEADGSAGALPHLSHALAATWNERSGGPLTLDIYRQVGGVAGALGATADAAVARLDDTERAELRRLLLRLVVPGRGHQPDVRGAVRRDELGSDQNQIIDRLARDRLVTVDEDGVQLAHEALLSSWPQLREWLAESRADLLSGSEFQQAVRSWEEHDRDPEQLLRGTALDQVERWVDRAGPELTAVESDFLTRSRQRRHRARSLRRVVVSVLVLLLGVSVTAALVATRQSDRASAASRTALARRLASESENALLRNDVSLAALLAATGEAVSSTIETRSALFQSLVSDVDASIVLEGHAADVRALAISPDGTVVTGDLNGSILLWRDDGRPTVLTGHDGEVLGLTAAADGKSVVSVGSDGRVILWNLERLAPEFSHLLTGVRARGSSGGRSGAAGNGSGGGNAGAGTESGEATDSERSPRLRSVASSSQGRIAIGGEGGIWMWDGDDGSPSLWFQHPTEVRSVAWHPDGGLLAAADRDGSVFVVDQGGKVVARHPEPHADVAHSVAWAAGGDALLSAGRDRSIRRWEPGSDVVIVVPDAHAGEVYAVTAASDGALLATAGADDRVRLWAVDSLRNEGTLAGHQGDVRVVAFDGQRLVSGGTDNTVRRWVAGRSGAVSVLLESDRLSGILDLDGSPDHVVTVAGTRTGQVVWWQRSSDQPPISVDVHSGRVNSVRLLPDGSALSGGADGLLMRSASDGSILTVADVDSPIASLAVTAGSAVAGTESGDVIVVDLSSREQSLVLDLGAEVDSLDTVDPTPRLVAGTQDGRVILLERNGGRWTQRELVDLGGEVHTVAADPAGGRVAGGGASAEIVVFETSRWTAESILTGHTSDVRDVDWSEDGRFLVSVSRDQTIRLWNSDGTELGSARVHAADNRAVHVGSGALVTTADNTGETVRWPGPAGWSEAACQIAGRTLTEDEWALHADPDSSAVAVCRPGG